MSKVTDNYGKPRSLYSVRLAAMDDRSLESECSNLIWLSAYATNNPRSDYHWQADACWDECQRREKPEIYRRGWNGAVRSAGHEHLVREEAADAT